MTIHSKEFRANTGPSRQYDPEFRVDAAYRASLPDLQNGEAALIRGARKRIQRVGISNFKLPLQIALRDCGAREVSASVTGSVSIDAHKKGINMSRVMRSFYGFAEESFGFNVIDSVLDAYCSDLESDSASILMRFSLPLKVESLRSGLSGWQYYDAAFEMTQRGGERTRITHLDYVYASTCPCSLELSEHARATRNQLATPHSQRSVARLSMVLDPAAPQMWFEDVVALCRAAVPTETQVMVKREDEQAFAELNAANPIFVEDAARLFAEVMLADQRIGDYRVIASHQESLHSHDAVSVLTEGETFDAVSLDPRLFGTLVHAG